MSVSPTGAWPTNSASTQNIMNTFHSSGTPIGIDDRMPKWKHSITNAAIAVGQPPWEKNSTSGTRPSIAVLKCAMNRDIRPGRRSSGKCSKNFRLMNRGRNNRVVAHHRRDHEREVLVELGRGRADPDHQADELGGDDHVHPVAGEQERHRERRVHLAAGGQEDHLVAQAEHGQQPEDRPDLPHRQHADRGAERRDRTRCRRRTARPAASPAARRTARHRPGVRVVPLVSGIRLGPRWQPNGVGPQPVQDRTHRREEPVVQRTEPAAQPDDLEQHRVEHDLLEHDRLGLPRRDVGEAVDALGRQRRTASRQECRAGS